MNECPASVEYRGAEGYGNIQRGETRRAECGHQQDKLKIRHLGAMDIECLHDRWPPTCGIGKTLHDGDASVPDSLVIHIGIDIEERVDAVE